MSGKFFQFRLFEAGFTLEYPMPTEKNINWEPSAVNEYNDGKFTISLVENARAEATTFYFEVIQFNGAFRKRFCNLSAALDYVAKSRAPEPKLLTLPFTSLPFTSSIDPNSSVTVQFTFKSTRPNQWSRYSSNTWLYYSASGNARYSLNLQEGGINLILDDMRRKASVRINNAETLQRYISDIEKEEGECGT